MSVIIGYIAIAAVGITLGLVGAGGSILTVPIMVYLFGYSSSDATGFSLGVVGGTALVALINYWRQGKVDLRVVGKFVPASILGVLISRKILVPAIPAQLAVADHLVFTKDNLIMLAFAVVMLLAAKSMLSSKKVTSHSQKSDAGIQKIAADIAAALSTGIVTGFVGAGGGFLIIPALVSLMGLEMSVAVGTSLIIIAINSISGFISVAMSRSDTPWVHLCLMLGISSVAAFISAKWADKVPQQKLKKAFGWFILVMGCAIIGAQIQRS